MGGIVNRALSKGLFARIWPDLRSSQGASVEWLARYFGGSREHLDQVLDTEDAEFICHESIREQIVKLLGGTRYGRGASIHWVTKQVRRLDEMDGWQHDWSEALVEKRIREEVEERPHLVRDLVTQILGTPIIFSYMTTKSAAAIIAALGPQERVLRMQFVAACRGITESHGSGSPERSWA